jgi:transcriptional regulator with XRE-family HTH domain
MNKNWLLLVNEMEQFANSLKKVREAIGLNQNSVAELLDISPRVYNRWERGAAIPRLDTIVKLADIFNVSLDELTGRNALKNRDTLKISNPKLHSLYKEIDKLSSEDQQALIILIDSLVKRSQMNHIMAK